MTATSLEIVGIVLAALGGTALAVQAGVNSSLGRHVGKGLAGIISFGSGLVFLVIYFLISTYAAKAQGPTASGFKGMYAVGSCVQVPSVGRAERCTMYMLFLSCRSSVVLVHWRLPGGLLCDHCHSFCSATGKWHPDWGSSHCTTCDSHILGWLWVGGLCQAPGALASYCRLRLDGHWCRTCLGLSWYPKAKHQLRLHEALHRQVQWHF